LLAEGSGDARHREFAVQVMTFLGALFAGGGIAGTLGAVEFGEGSLVATVPVAAVAHDVVDAYEFAVRFAGLVAKDSHVAELVLRWDFGLLFGMTTHRKFESEGFGAVKATEGPAALGDVVDGEALACGLRFVDRVDLGAEFLELGCVLVFEDDVPGDG